MNKSKANFILTTDLIKQIKEAARQQDLSQSALVRRALKQYLAGLVEQQKIDEFNEMSTNIEIENLKEAQLC